MSGRKIRTGINGLKGSIEVPGDKSISHRSVMFGSIAEGETIIEHFLPGADCLSTINCFRSLGVPITQEGTSVRIQGRGLGGLQEPANILDVGNSGTTIRLMLGILSARPFQSVLSGDESIARRPMTRVVNPLKEMGADIDGASGGEFTPLTVKGRKLTGISYTLPVASAQVKSAILLAGLQAEGTTVITEPEPTRDHTERMLAQFGAPVVRQGRNITIEGGRLLKGTSIYVPGDISSAAFFMVAAAITDNSEVLLKNVGLNPTRTGIIEVMQKMGADIAITEKESNGEPFGDILVRSSKLKGTVIEGSLIPRLIDEIPILALLALKAEGVTVIKDAAELKVKETNRIDTVAEELAKLGAEIEAAEDGLIIHGGSSLTGGSVSSRGDHRIGMMLAIAGLAAEGDVFLDHAEAIDVSYPGFFDDLHSLID